MRASIRLAKMRHFILEFIGGAWDAMNLHSPSPDPIELRLAQQTYRKTGQGTTGREVTMPSGYATMRGMCCCQKYVVTEHTEVQGEVLVRLECFDGAEEAAGSQEMPEMPSVSRIFLCFEGGYLDGQCFDSCSPDHQEALLVVAWFLVVEHDWLGHGWHGLPFRNLLRARGHKGIEAKDGQYIVTQRIDELNLVILTLRHVSPEV